MPTSAPHTALSLYTLRDGRAGQPNSTQTGSNGRRISTRLTNNRWPSVKCHNRQQGAAWVFGSFLFFLPSRRAHAAPWRRRSPRVCCVEDHVDDARRPQPRSPTLPPWVGWLGEKASPVGKHRPRHDSFLPAAQVHNTLRETVSASYARKRRRPHASPCHLSSHGARRAYEERCIPRCVSAASLAASHAA